MEALIETEYNAYVEDALVCGNNYICKYDIYVLYSMCGWCMCEFHNGYGWMCEAQMCCGICCRVLLVWRKAYGGRGDALLKKREAHAKEKEAHKLDELKEVTALNTMVEDILEFVRMQRFNSAPDALELKGVCEEGTNSNVCSPETDV